MKLRLKQLRRARLLSQRDLAALAGVGEATIVRLEQGAQEANWKTLRRLAAALNVEPAELVEMEQESE